MRDFLKLSPVFLCLAVWTFSIQSHPFFWDTVQLASKQAHHFFENGLQWTPLPPEIDSGHPPVFGYYLALVWSIAGKTLPVSHWAMFPFLCGITWMLYRIGSAVSGPEWAGWLILLAFSDPVLAGQSALVSPDIVLIFCFLSAVHGLYNHRLIWTMLGVLGLCAVSMRGMMTAGALFLWQAIAHWRPGCFFKPPRFSWLAFFPGFAFGLWFLVWHFQATGWAAYHSESPWAPAFEPAKGIGIFRNLLIIGWRWTDFGRIFEWILLGTLLLGYGFREGRQPTGTKSAKNNWFGRHFKEGGTILLLFICLVFFLTPSAVLYKILSAHRYFMPLFLIFHLILIQQIVQANLTMFRKRILIIITAAGLFGGNFWIYPRGISMDWDATLAHLPYHRLRSEMIEFMEQRNIDFQSVGTMFPNINTGENLLLNGDNRKFAEKDFSQNKYILASNIFNDFSEADYQTLERDWSLIKISQKGGIWLKLYKSPE